MKKNLVAMMVTVVMVAGALIGCGSKEVAQETTPVAEASVAEATVEENAVDAAASTEESIAAEATEEASIEENAVEENSEASEYTRETYSNALDNSNCIPYGAFMYFCGTDGNFIVFIEDEITEDYNYTGYATKYIKKVEDDVDFYNVIESLNSIEDFLNDPAVVNAGQNDYNTARIINTVFDYPEDAYITEFNEVNLPLKMTFYDSPVYIVWWEATIVDVPSSESSTQE